jgi:hypothetical protein
MNKKIVIPLAVVAVMGIAFAFEMRYSGDMQEHIDSVNRDLEQVRLEASYSNGLMGSLQTMKDEADVAREIMETRDHVHTLKDQVLASKIKEAAEDGATVGGAIQSVIAKWPDSV